MPGSSVGIAIGYGLNGPGIESRWGARFSAPVQIAPGTHPASCTMGTRSFPAVKSGRGVSLTPRPLLVPWSWKRRATPLLPLWAVRPVQSLSACTRVHTEMWRDSSVGIATRYELDGPGIESRCGEVFRTCLDRPWGPPSLLYNSTRSFPGVKRGRGVTLTPHPLLVPWSWNPLWVVRPVQSLIACTRVHFTFTLLQYLQFLVSIC